jgi:copper ion binding protein
MSTETYTVTGMTCGHCVSSVSAGVGAISGVTDVDVDLTSGRVTVTSEQPVSTEQVREAVEEAGYTLASLTAALRRSRALGSAGARTPAHEHSSVRIEGQRIVEVPHGSPLHPGRQPGHLTGAKPPRAAAQ